MHTWLKPWTTLDPWGHSDALLGLCRLPRGRRGLGRPSTGTKQGPLWHVGKVVKVTGRHVQLELSHDLYLLKVNHPPKQGRNSNQKSVIGVRGVGMSFEIKLAPNILPTAPGASWDITSWMSCWKFATSQPISTYLKSCLFLTYRTRDKKLSMYNRTLGMKKLSIHRHIFHVTRLVFCNTCFRWDIPVLSMWRLFLERCSHADSEHVIDAGIEVSSETARRQRSFPELLNNVLHLRSSISLHVLWVQIWRNRNSDPQTTSPQDCWFCWAILPKWPDVSGES